MIVIYKRVCVKIKQTEKKMKLQSITPTVYHISYFKYSPSERVRPRLSHEKTQYTYRIIMVDEGQLDVSACGATHRLLPGDVLYLLPGDTYRILPRESDFSLVSVYFDFCDNACGKSDRLFGCVFLDSFDPSLSMPVIYFEDAIVFNRCGVFRGCDRQGLSALMYADRGDSFYPFYARVALLSLISDMLGASKRHTRNIAAERIVDYIRKNPERELSGDELAEVFSYHKNYINKLIKAQTGKSVNEYVRYVKIEYAKSLIREHHHSLGEVAHELGYYDHSHFYKAFVAETGMSPTEYIKDETAQK